MSKNFFIYILASKRNGTLYIGVTSNLQRRIAQHKEGAVDGFSKKYGTKLLVYFESVDSAEAAFTREKQLKSWKRNWKLELIEKANSKWDDLYGEIF